MGNKIPNNIFKTATLTLFNGTEFEKDGKTYKIINSWFQGFGDTYRIVLYDILDVTTGIVYAMAKDKIEKTYLEYKTKSLCH